MVYGWYGPFDFYGPLLCIFCINWSPDSGPRGKPLDSKGGGYKVGFGLVKAMLGVVGDCCEESAALV